MPVVRGGYGYNLFSTGDYGTEGQVIDASASITSVSAFAAEGGRDLKSSASSGSTAVFSSDAVRVAESSGSVTSTVTIAASGESIIIERSDKVPYGASVYGYNRYDLNDLQTIVSGTSAVAVANGLRVQSSGGESSTNSSLQASAEIIRLGEAISATTATADAAAVYVFKGEGTVSGNSSVTIDYIRERKSQALASSTSGTLTIGREKWEPIPYNSSFWTNVA